MAIKTEVQEMANKIAENIKIEKDGTAVISNDPYVANLPESLSVETIKAVHDYNTAFIAGSGLAFGQAAVDAMASNKKLDEVTATFNMVGKDNVTHNIVRSREGRNPKENTTVTKYGAMTTVHEVHGSSQKVGQLGAVRATISQLATERFGKA